MNIAEKVYRRASPLALAKERRQALWKEGFGTSSAEQRFEGVQCERERRATTRLAKGARLVQTNCGRPLREQAPDRSFDVELHTNQNYHAVSFESTIKKASRGQGYIQFHTDLIFKQWMTHQIEGCGQAAKAYESGWKVFDPSTFLYIY